MRCRAFEVGYKVLQVQKLMYRLRWRWGPVTEKLKFHRRPRKCARNSSAGEKYKVLEADQWVDLIT